MLYQMEKLKHQKAFIFPSSKNSYKHQLLGNGVCFSVLQELATENTYRASNQQESAVILPDGAKRETFTV